MTMQEEYRAFCTGRDDVPLFMQPYWLDLVCPHKQWDALMSHDGNGAVRGAWAYAYGRSRGLRWIRLPVITPFTGIWSDIPEGLPRQKQIALRHEILHDLARQLPRVHIFELKVQWPLQDWLPFYWRGYRQETRYTFRFDPIDVEGIHENFSKSFRRNLRAAERHYDIREGSAAQLYPLMERVFAMREATSHLSPEVLGKVVEQMQARGQGRVYTAFDNSGLQAALFAVWDSQTTYYLIGGRSRTDSRHGMNLLLWHAIQDAGARGHSFDFEGSMIEGVNQFFQSFGASLTPYFYLYRYRGIAKLKYL
jgi:hypothetical protein